jgi:MoaA/NifB/PqqE/SkfB family radical SAM enzyme
MLRRAKETGRAVEAITNGTLLDNEMSEKIVDAKLDMLWLSLDSMEEESYENIRCGAKFSGVMDNIHLFNKTRFHPYWLNRPDKAKVKLGIAFVLMKNNLAQFKKLLTKARSLGVAEVKATHLIPYESSMLDHICYERILGLGMYGARGTTSVYVDMPFMDTQDVQEHDMLPLISKPPISFSIMGTPLRIKEGYCRFVQEGVAFVRWDGEVCPCAALLHENTVYQQDRARHVRHCSYGNIKEKSLLEIWESASYASFRRRVINFEFSPCAFCGPCDFFDSNEKDCFGNTFPTCGACLWAQGMFQCP